ncbi:hypothetical protein Cgig2_029343 [Carnegiea gigantea]|uniref:AAA+ ATPase domain-containing protein n=1 Tax=Carnegiea gigantea TaxID=171969 RepID=A0A9Q1KSA5_9CARY|nr:hypothetical protein Cgig2_029343 [Carnegiea gigantea]
MEVLWTDDFVAFESRRRVFNEIMETLKEENVSIIGICGMGGIGKTKLVMEIGKKAKNEGVFDEVVMTMASQDPDIRRMQGILADMLRLVFNGTSEADRAAELSERLKKERRVLIILDDVWEKLSLADIGMPSTLDHKCCKLILTTRRVQVRDDMCCQRMFHLDALDDSEALYLFSKHARITPYGNPQHHSMAKKVVKECGGLPLAIETVGSALRKKSLPDYDDAIRKLSHSAYADIESVDREIYPAIKLSVDYLNCKETVGCLTLFSLYPEDNWIDLEDFTRIAFGIGLFENVNSVEEARQNTLRCVTRLLDACLLLPSQGTLESWKSFQQIYETWNNALVSDFGDIPSMKVHDIVRDVALWLSRKDKFFYMQKSPSKKQSKEYEDAIAISIKDCGLDCRLKCPKLKLLLVETGISGLQDGCFETMSALQVLKVNVVVRSDMDIFAERAFPASMQHLHDLRTFLFGSFYTRWCPGKHLSVIGMLKNLQILRLEWLHIEQLAQEIEELSSLKLLDLFWCSNLEKIPRNVLSSLTALEELYLGGSEVEKDVFLEITSLPHLTALTARVNFAGSLPTVSFRKPLRRYTIFDVVVEDWAFRLKWSRNVLLDVVDCSEMASLQQLFPQVEFLYIRRLRGAWENLFPGCSQAPLLKIDACDVDCLVDTAPLFSNLQELVLADMSKMTRLCNSPSPPGWLPNLIEAEIGHYHGSQNIVPHIIPIGSKLQGLRVKKCPRLKHFFEFGPQHLRHITNEMSLLRSPTELSLVDLHELTAIWKWPHQTETLDLTKNDSHDEFCNLIPEAMFRSLNSLTTLEIWDCEKVEEVFQLIDYNDQKYKEQLSNLTTVRLFGLRQLRCICKGPQQNLHLRKLECIELHGCSKLTSILSPASATSLRKLRSIKICKCQALESIISPEEDELSTSAASLLMVVSINIPELEEIYISSCHELKSILPVSILAQGLPQLRDISIAHCAKLEQVFGDREGTLTDRDEIALNGLNNLELENLPSLVHFTTTKGHLICPSLKVLTVKCCPLLGKSFRIGQALDGYVHRKEQVQHQNLNNEVVEGQLMEYCQDIIWTSPLQNFVRLKSVELTDFHEAKELFDLSGMIIDQPLCSWLESLDLQSLTALNHIWRGPIRSVQLLYLKYLRIDECPNLRTLFTSTIIAGSLKKLERIEIRNCINLETILVMGKLDFLEVPFFPALSKINIKGCNKLKSVLPLSVAQELPQLQSLEIENCPVLQHVFSADEGEHTDYGNLHDIKLPKLWSLKLAKVPSSMLFTSANLLVSCPNLEDLFFAGIEESEPTHLTLRFPHTEVAEPSEVEYITEPSDHHVEGEEESFSAVTYLERLREIKVEGCDRLNFIFPLSVAQRLPSLEEIIVKGARQLEQVIGTDERKRRAKNEESVLPYLRILKLEDLPRLSRIFQTGYSSSHEPEAINLKYLWKGSFNPCHLQQIVVRNCPTLEYIFEPIDQKDEHGQGSHLSCSSASTDLCNLSHIELRVVSIRIRGIEDVCSVYQLHYLTHLEIIECPDLRTLFTSTVARALKTLEQIKIKSCQSLDTIRALGEGHSVDEIDLIEPTCFSSLWQIEIEGCHKLQSVIPFSAAQKFTKLKIEIKNCQNLEAFLAMGEGHSTDEFEFLKPTCLGTLQETETEGCHKLKSVLPELRILRLEDLPCLSRIFPASYGLSRLLVAKLQQVFVKNCNIEEVFNLREGLNSSSHEPKVLNLEELYLLNLPNLKHIWTGSVNPKHEQGSPSSCGFHINRSSEIEDY